MRREPDAQIIVVEYDILRFEQDIAQDLGLIAISGLDAAVADYPSRQQKPFTTSEKKKASGSDGQD